jgi:hypothetical protein
MSNGKQLWPGDTMRAFFRAHIQRETGLDPAAAEKLSDALTKAVNRMLVWDLPAEAPVSVSAAVGKGKPKPQAVESAAAPADPPAFDPYAFSAMVVLAKTGKDGLLKRLAEIKNVADLKALAEAQHLAVNGNLKKPEELRKAIIAATEQRLADRKAAAS